MTVVMRALAVTVGAEFVERVGRDFGGCGDPLSHNANGPPAAGTKRRLRLAARSRWLRRPRVHSRPTALRTAHFVRLT